MKIEDIIGVDKEVIQIIDSLNSLPGIETFESCCGHGKEPFRVFFTCRSWSSLAILARCMDRNYSSGKFCIKAINCDDSPCFNFILESYEPFTSEQMDEEITMLIRNIKYWSDPIFKNYFL